MPRLYYRPGLQFVPVWYRHHSLMWYLFMSPFYMMWFMLVLSVWMLVLAGYMFVLVWYMLVWSYKGVAWLVNRVMDSLQRA